MESECYYIQTLIPSKEYLESFHSANKESSHTHICNTLELEDTLSEVSLQLEFEQMIKDGVFLSVRLHFPVF